MHSTETATRAHCTPAFISSSCQKWFPSKCFCSDPAEMKSLGTMPSHLVCMVDGQHIPSKTATPAVWHWGRCHGEAHFLGACQVVYSEWLPSSASVFCSSSLHSQFPYSLGTQKGEYFKHFKMQSKTSFPEFLGHIITNDEMWVCHFTLTLKAASMSWNRQHPHEKEALAVCREGLVDGILGHMWLPLPCVPGSWGNCECRPLMCST
jgi:hypothetical protein